MPGIPGFSGFSGSSTSCSVLRPGVFLSNLPQNHVSTTARPTLSENNRVAPTGPFVYGGHDSARDASALRPRLCQDPSGVRGRCTLPSNLEKKQLQQQLYIYVLQLIHADSTCFVCRLSTYLLIVHFTHVLSHVLLAKKLIQTFISRDLRVRRSRY